MISYDICLSLSDLLHWVWSFLGPSMLLQTAWFHSFFISLSRLAVLVYRHTGWRFQAVCKWRAHRCLGHCGTLGAQSGNKQAFLEWQESTNLGKSASRFCFVEVVGGYICIQGAHCRYFRIPPGTGQPWVTRPGFQPRPTLGVLG